jgi:hypothetical protein
MSQAGKRRSLLRSLMELLRRVRRRKPPMPEDPYAYKFAPVRRGPKGRSGAAVAEPEDDSYRAFPPRKQ